MGEENEDTSFIGYVTGTTGRITALLIAIAGLLAAVPQFRDAVQSAYCAILPCSVFHWMPVGQGDCSVLRTLISTGRFRGQMTSNQMIANATTLH
jgi:hypothetical protein